MKKHLLEVDSIAKSFDGRKILSDVYLKCETGEVVGLLGRNGSGKSTLLKIIYGIQPADFKFVRIDNKVLSEKPGLHHEISYLHQENFIPNHLTVKRAISLSIEKQFISEFFNDEIIEDIAHKKISQLSGGELRYLEIKIILSNPSEFVLLDEPYNGLSPMMIEKVNELVKKNSLQKGIVITDHNYKNVLQISNRLILMRDGKAHHLENNDQLITNGYLSDGML